MEIKKVFMTCGLHSSGVKEISDMLYNFYKPNAIIISRFDDVDLALSKYDVVIICGHTVRSFSRTSIIKNISQENKNNTEIICVMAMTPWIACIARDREDLDDIIINELRWFQVPFYEEGFDDIVLIRTMPKGFQTTKWMSNYEDEMANFNLDNQYNLLQHGKSMSDIYGIKYPSLRIGAFFHDLGKLKTKKFNDAIQTYDGCIYDGYEALGAYEFLTAQFYNKYYNSKFKDFILDNAFIINYHPYGVDPFYDNNSLLYKFDQTSAKSILLHMFGQKKTDMLLSFAKCHEKIS